MLRKYFFILVSLAVCGLITGCARRIVVAEVMQQPQGQKIYLKHNLWYQAAKSGTDNEISCLNIQQGVIIPLGTAVEPVKATDGKLSFKTADGKTFVIDYDHSLTLLPMEAYIKSIFTLETRQQLCKGISTTETDMILRGDIWRGMTKSQVLLALGIPAACRTPSILNNTWVYWTTEDSVYRVVFRNDRVNAIVDISDKPKTLSRPVKKRPPVISDTKTGEKKAENGQSNNG
ncbi:MAG: hypothetical protein PHV59_03955 [Victivallales bacterium]|nr:hypothetical protein [Victivallales bacterium]